MKRLTIVTIAIGLAALISVPANSEVLEVSSSKDNTLFESEDGSLSNGSGPEIFAGTNGQNLRRRGLLYFDFVDALPEVVVVDSVFLYLSVTNAPNETTQSFSLSVISEEWGEGSSVSNGGQGAPAEKGDATWLHRFYPNEFWSEPGGSDDPTGNQSFTLGGNGTYEISGPRLTLLVSAAADGVILNEGWILRGSGDLNSARRIASRENTNANLRPRLVIHYRDITPIRETSWGRLKKVLGGD